MRVIIVLVLALVGTQGHAQSLGDTVKGAVKGAVKQMTSPPPTSVDDAAQRAREVLPDPSAQAQGLPNPLGGTLAPPNPQNMLSCKPEDLVAPLKAAKDLIEAQAKVLETQATALKNAAAELKQANENLKSAATNLTQAQLNFIKKTVEEAGALLLNPFKPLIDFVNEYIPTIKWIKDKLEEVGWKIIGVTGFALAFFIGFPFWALIRRITPKGKA